MINKNSECLVAGVDEAGRGPLAGPVYAAAVILPSVFNLPLLKDSKKLSIKQREKLFNLIREQAICYAIASASVAEIEQLNILQATLLAMSRAIEQLPIKPKKIMIDGNQVPKNLLIPCQAIVKGDDLIPAISAASILAKVTRDREMTILDSQYPQYGFAQHKGYGTKKHIAAIQALGITPHHRKTFEPIKSLFKLEKF